MTIADALLRECGKDKVSYKSAALTALGEALESLDEDRFQDVYSIVQGILTKVRNLTGTQLYTGSFVLTATF